MAAEPDLRRAAIDGDRAAMHELAHLLLATSRPAEARHWQRRLDEARWADRAIALGALHYPPVVLLGAGLVALLGALTTALAARLLLWLPANPGDPLALALLLVAALIAGATAAGSWSAALGMLRGAPRAASRGAALARFSGSVAVVVTLWVIGHAWSDSSIAGIVAVAVLGGLPAALLFGLATLLRHCIRPTAAVRAR